MGLSSYSSSPVILLMFSMAIQYPVGAIPGSMDSSFPAPPALSAPISQFVSGKIKLYC